MCRVCSPVVSAHLRADLQYRAVATSSSYMAVSWPMMGCLLVSFLSVWPYRSKVRMVISYFMGYLSSVSVFSLIFLTELEPGGVPTSTTYSSPKDSDFSPDCFVRLEHRFTFFSGSYSVRLIFYL